MLKIDRSRIAFVFFGFILFFFILIFNLYILQIRQSIFFNQLANQQYNITKTAKPARAEIFDRNGQVLALNKDTYAAFIIPKKLEQVVEIKEFLKTNFPDAYQRLSKYPKAHFLYVKRRLTPEDKEIIIKSNLSDIKFLTEPGRFYSTVGLAPIIGITDIDNNGILGLELQYNKKLGGVPTTSILEKDARSGYFYFKKETKIAGIQGSIVNLTLDSNLQFLVYEELKDNISNLNYEEGSVLIIDPNNGDILAMANYPDYDSNLFTNYSVSNTKNKILTECYEFGSVIKIFLALSGFAENIVTTEESIDCLNSNKIIIDGVKIGTPKAHGILPFSQVIAKSNNIGCVKIAQRLGSKIYDHYKKVGFGVKTNLNFPGEQSGYLTPPERWSKSTLFTLSYGYAVNLTLLQLARAFCLISNNGYMIEPRLNLDNPIIKSDIPIYSSEVIKQIREVLLQTTNEVMAKKGHISGYTILGKTGTANLLTDGKYDKTRNIFTFVGIIEKDNYKRLIITFIKGKGYHDTFASSVAVPLFESVAQKMLIHDKIIN